VKKRRLNAAFFMRAFNMGNEVENNQYQKASGADSIE